MSFLGFILFRPWPLTLCYHHDVENLGKSPMELSLFNHLKFDILFQFVV